MNVVADDLVLLNFSIIRKYRPCIPTSAYSAHEGQFHVLLRQLPLILKVTCHWCIAFVDRPGRVFLYLQPSCQSFSASKQRN